ncbi:MAG: HDOD domain-containing protein [Desulfovibrionaceae bacterium]
MIDQAWRILFVDDEKSVLEGLERMIFAMGPDWEAEFAQTGEEALEMLEEDDYDVVVSDMRMPGMDGVKLLSKVQKLHPDVVRIVLSGHSDREMVLKTVRPAHQFLSKPCTPRRLREVVDSALGLRQIRMNKQIRRIISRIETLPSLPELYMKVSDELDKDEPSLQQVGAIISEDMGMSASILKLVNSSFFGFRRRITSPQQAVNLLGVETIKGVILSAHIFTMFDFEEFPGFSLPKLWNHCMVTARMARALAEVELCSRQTQDECFVAGLLHDVGKLVLATHFQDEYHQILDTVRTKNYSIWEAEKQIVGATHAEIGAYLLGLWGLPLPVVSAIAFHHEPCRVGLAGFSSLVAVHAANAFEHELYVTDPSMAEHPLDQACLEKSGLDGRVDDWRRACLELAREDDDDAQDPVH